jgi:hypothetical protein
MPCASGSSSDSTSKAWKHFGADCGAYLWASFNMVRVAVKSYNEDNKQHVDMHR